MAGKLLRNISPDKTGNRDAEYYKQALDLSPGYSDLDESNLYRILKQKLLKLNHLRILQCYYFLRTANIQIQVINHDK
jgi:hypothetical protein